MCQQKPQSCVRLTSSVSCETVCCFKASQIYPYNLLFKLRQQAAGTHAYINVTSTWFSVLIRTHRFKNPKLSTLIRNRPFKPHGNYTRGG